MLTVPTDETRSKYADYEVVILTPCQAFWSSSRFMKSVVNLVAYSWMHGLRVYQMGITQRMAVDWARNDLAGIVQDKINEYTGNKFTHLLWLDDDHVFNPDLAVHLAQHGDLDMVSALYFQRQPPHKPVVCIQDYTTDYKHFHLALVPKAIVQVDAVGFGALLMRREVLDVVPKPWFTLDYRAGEDIAFCTHARKFGIKIFVDGGYTIGHVGEPPVISEQDYLACLQAHPELQGDMTRVAMATRNQPIEQDRTGEAPVIWHTDEEG